VAQPFSDMNVYVCKLNGYMGNKICLNLTRYEGISFKITDLLFLPSHISRYNRDYVALIKLHSKSPQRSPNLFSSSIFTLKKQCVKILQVDSALMN